MESTLPTIRQPKGFPSPLAVFPPGVPVWRNAQVFEPKASGAWYLHRFAGMFFSLGSGRALIRLMIDPFSNPKPQDATSLFFIFSSSIQPPCGKFQDSSIHAAGHTLDDKLQNFLLFSSVAASRGSSTQAIGRGQGCSFDAFDEGEMVCHALGSKRSQQIHSSSFISYRVIWVL